MQIAVMTRSRHWAPILDAFVRSEHAVVGVVRPEPKDPPRGIVRLNRAIRGDTSPLARYCARRRIPLLAYRGDNREILRWLGARRPDLLVVFAVPYLLPEAVFELPRFGSLNLHPSLLPRYRGPEPLFWSYHAFDRGGGVTVHRMDAGEDTGPILVQRRCRIPLGARADDVLGRAVAEQGAEALCLAADEIAEGTEQPRVQPQESPTVRARRVTSEEARDVIGWETFSVDHIYHLLGGYLNELDLLPALAHRRGEYWTVTRFDRVVPRGAPGSIYLDDGAVYLACIDGRVELVRRRLPLFQRFSTNATTIATPSPR